jgi:hypothetical protein
VFFVLGLTTFFATAGYEVYQQVMEGFSLSAFTDPIVNFNYFYANVIIIPAFVIVDQALVDASQPSMGDWGFNYEMLPDTIYMYAAGMEFILWWYYMITGFMHGNGAGFWGSTPRFLQYGVFAADYVLLTADQRDELYSNIEEYF